MADNNKVTFGFSNVHIAFFSDDSTDASPKWDVPIPIPGAVSFEPSAQNNEYKFYADNGTYYSTYTDNGYTGDLIVAKFPDEVLSKMFGWEIDATTGGIMETAGGFHKDFALLAQAEGDKIGRRLVFYRCAGGKPSQSMSTTEENMTVQTQTMNITVSPLDISQDKKIVKFVLANDSATPGAAAAYSSFFDAVLVPGMGA